MTPVVPRPERPCFMFCCLDGPNAGALRDRDFEKHLAHVESHWDEYLIAGPLRAPGETPLNGSLFLVYAETVADAWALMRQDPYIYNGQYAQVEVRAFAPSIGVALGGKTWSDSVSLRARAGSATPPAADCNKEEL